MRLPQPAEIVMLVSADRKRFVFALGAGETDAMHTHHGIVPHAAIRATPYGGRVASHTGASFLVLRPSFEQILLTTQRATQILYPKDIGLLLLKLSIVPGTRVAECGTGSGALTTALARYVTPGGRVFSYEARAEAQEMARRNLARLGLDGAVDFHVHDIADGFLETDLDALFLDVKEPWAYLDQALAALSGGGFLGALVPTVNQVVALTDAFADRPLAEVDVCEVLLRQFRAVPGRIRPFDRLTAHTGYLLFARKLEPGEPPEPPADARRGKAARKATEHRATRQGA